jgi:hypothetical protein
LTRRRKDMGDTGAQKRFTCERCGHIHKVVIFKEGCTYRVEPGRLVVHSGALVWFVSLLPDPEIVFPHGIAERQTSVKSHILFQVTAGELGAYPYAVFVDGGRDMAEGGSAPRIIVVDP